MIMPILQMGSLSVREVELPFVTNEKEAESDSNPALLIPTPDFFPPLISRFLMFIHLPWTFLWEYLWKLTQESLTVQYKIPHSCIMGLLLAFPPSSLFLFIPGVILPLHPSPKLSLLCFHWCFTFDFELFSVSSLAKFCTFPDFICLTPKFNSFSPK